RVRIRGGCPPGTESHPERARGRTFAATSRSRAPSPGSSCYSRPEVTAVRGTSLDRPAVRGSPASSAPNEASLSSVLEVLLLALSVLPYPNLGARRLSPLC